MVTRISVSSKTLNHRGHREHRESHRAENKSEEQGNNRIGKLPVRFSRPVIEFVFLSDFLCVLCALCGSSLFPLLEDPRIRPQVIHRLLDALADGQLWLPAE